MESGTGELATANANPSCRPLSLGSIVKRVHRFFSHFGRQMAFNPVALEVYAPKSYCPLFPMNQYAITNPSRTPKPGDRRDINHGWLLEEFRIGSVCGSLCCGSARCGGGALALLAAFFFLVSVLTPLAICGSVSVIFSGDSPGNGSMTL